MAKSPTNGLPGAPDAEKMILGAILLDDSFYPQVAAALRSEDFLLDRNRRIFQRMGDLNARGVRIDRMVLANELSRYKELESDGLSYLVSLDDGMPERPNLAGYIQIVKEKSRLRQIVFAAQRTRDQALAGEANSTDILVGAQSTFNTILDGDGQSRVETPREFIQNYPGGVDTLLTPSKWKPGIPIGFKQLDAWTAGLHECEILLIGARPGTGKTALIAGILKNLAFAGTASLFFSLEMSKEMIIQRMFCQEAGVSVDRFRAGECLDDELMRIREATARVAELPIYIDDSASQTVASMRGKLQALKQERPLGLWAVDYGQLIRPNPKIRHSTENEMFTHIAHELQETAKQTGVPLVLLSQLNRESTKRGADQRPRLSDCRGAGAWEEIANVGALIYRESLVRKDRTDLLNKAELIVDKNRSGPSGNIPLEFIGYLMRFQDPD